MKNLNIKKNPITTIFGILLMLTGIVMILAPMFITVPQQYIERWWIPLVVFLLGFLSAVSPDSIVTGAKQGVDKFTRDKNNSND